MVKTVKTKKNLVIIGGGTGLPALLSGVKNIEEFNVKAIVTVIDSGSSTGKIRRFFQIPAIGDLRRVISSLSQERDHLKESMEFRIKGTNTDLDGHSLGNFIILSQIKRYNSFSKGIKETCKMLNIKGQVIPVSNDSHHLYAELENGKIVEGEEKIGHSKSRIKKVFYNSGKASKEAIEAIKEADYIVFGLGSLYTSLISNLIYKEIKKVLTKSKAKVYYFLNLFTQYGETDYYTLSDHVKAIEEHVGKNIIDKIIYDSSIKDPKIIKTYHKDKQELVKIDDYQKEKQIKYDLVGLFYKEKLWHDPKKVEKFFREVILKKDK